MKRIYLDHAATSPLRADVGLAMAECEGVFGNPSSLHGEGRRARALIDGARERVAGSLGCEFGEVVFTGSGTEAANLAVIGCALSNKDAGRRRVLFSAAEHPCVLGCRGWLERMGYVVELVPVDAEARTDPEALERALGPDVLLFAGMRANNETGSVGRTEAEGAACRLHGVLHLVDAVQWVPRPGDIAAWQADLVVVSPHKVGGPKGVGVLVVKAGTPCEAVTVGGGQERDMRAGTESVSAIVGAGVALSSQVGHGGVSAVRDLFESLLDGRFVRSVSGLRTAWHCHVRSQGIDSQIFLIRLDREGVSASAGSACSSGSIEPSHVLTACGFSDEEARCGLRFSFGPGTSLDDAREAAGRVNRVLDSLAP